MRTPDRPSDNLDDLRAQLPEEYRDAPLAEVPRLWIAVTSARRGRRADAIAYLTHLAPETIDRIIELAKSSDAT